MCFVVFGRNRGIRALWLKIYSATFDNKTFSMFAVQRWRLKKCVGLDRGEVVNSGILNAAAAGIAGCVEAGHSGIGEVTVLHSSSSGVERSSVL